MITRLHALVLILYLIIHSNEAATNLDLSMPLDHSLSIPSSIPITGIVVVVPGNTDYNEYVHRGSLFIQGLKSYITDEDKVILISSNPKNLERLNELSSTHSHFIYFSYEKYILDALCPSELWRILQKFQHRSYYAFQLDQYHLFPLWANESSLSTEVICQEPKQSLHFEVKLTLAYQRFNAILSRLLTDVDYTRFVLPQTEVIHVPLPIYNPIPQFNKPTDVLNVLFDIPRGIPENRSTSASFACELFSQAFHFYESMRKSNDFLLPLRVFLTDAMPSHVPPLPHQQIIPYMTREEFLNQLQSTHLYATAFLHSHESDMIGNFVCPRFHFFMLSQMPCRMEPSCFPLWITSSLNFTVWTIPSSAKILKRSPSVWPASSLVKAHPTSTPWLRALLSGSTSDTPLKSLPGIICME